MRIIAFNYTKIHGERFPKAPKTEKISSDLEFTNVEKDEIALMKEADILKVHFSYALKYDPKVAEILINGMVLLSMSSDDVKEAIKLWKKKQLPEKVKLGLVNVILNRCSLKALNMEEELSLPTHIKLVRINAQQPSN